MDITKQLLDEVVAQYATQEWTGGVFENQWETLALTIIDLDLENTQELLKLIFEKQEELTRKHQMKEQLKESCVFYKAIQLLSMKIHDYFWRNVRKLDEQNLNRTVIEDEIKNTLKKLNVFSLSVISSTNAEENYPFKDFVFKQLQHHLMEFKLLLDYYPTKDEIN